MKFFKNILTCTCLLLATACSDERLISPLNGNDGAPGPVSVTNVESLAGGAKITYNLPDNENLLYVKAVFTVREGLTREVKSSFYVNNLTVEGFPNSDDYQVTLYAVSRGEIMSEPVTVTVSPLTPPVQEVFQTLAIKETYGGLSLSFQNSGEAAVSITVITPSENGEVRPVETFYSKSKAATFYSRGFEPEARTFGVYIKDRWGNVSDTITKELTPIYEELLNKKNFQALKTLGGDNTTPHFTQWGMEKMWDDAWNNRDNIFQTVIGSGIPSSFTINLGVKAHLSRYKLYHRAGENIYSGAAVKIWEVWGSNEPDKDGGWVNWTKITDCTSFKPSDAALGTYTNEDVQYGIINGEDFNFPDDLPAYQYLRFKITQTWGQTDYLHISELTFWGQVSQ
jgi:hypothetical protein